MLCVLISDLEFSHAVAERGPGLFGLRRKIAVENHTQGLSGHRFGHQIVHTRFGTSIEHLRERVRRQPHDGRVLAGYQSSFTAAVSRRRPFPA